MAAIRCAELLCLCSVIACSVAAPAASQHVSQVEEDKQKKYFDLLKVADAKDFFSTPWHIGAVAGGGAALLLLVLGLIMTLSCYFCYKRRLCCFSRGRGHYGPMMERRPLRSDYRSHDALYTNRNPGQGTVEVRGHRHERTVGEEFQRQKEHQDQSDRATAKKIVLFHMRNEKHFELTKDLPDMGSRMLKFWFKIRDGEGREQLLTIAPVSQKCPLVLDEKTMRTINALLRQLHHPNLHPASGVSYVNKDHMVLIEQPYLKGGSLKDHVYRSTPTSEWTMKYSRRSKGLSDDKIALYGRQVLEGLLYLYEHKFPPLGHVQTGNIFVDGDSCQLGGYENTLLGYKTRSYKLCKEHLDDIDLILFGHAVFEMCCGYELTELVPGEQHYANVKSPKILQVLKFIFASNEDDGSFTHTIEQVHELEFFQAAEPPTKSGGRKDHTHLTSDMKSLLAKVAKNKPRVQKPNKRKKSRQRKSGTATQAEVDVAEHTSPSGADSAAPQAKVKTAQTNSS